MKKSSWGDAPKDSKVPIPKSTDELIDVVGLFIIENDSHQAIHAITTAMGLILMGMKDKDLENVRTVFDQMKFNVIDVLSGQGWK